jgi:SAM-dependent methyltransferase
MRYTGERAIPWDRNTGVHIMHAHVARYAWALGHVAGKYVVDLGCGAGYGSFMLSWSASFVYGYDNSQEAVGYAQRNFAAPNSAFGYWDFDLENTIPPADVYIAFEVLEHLKDPLALMRNLPDPLLWSLPVNDASRFHKHSYTFTDIHLMMAGSEFYYQDAAGLIVPESRAWFEPTYVLGVRG